MRAVFQRRTMRFWAVLFFFTLLFTISGQPAFASSEVPDEQRPVRVGLYYGSTAAPSFNLQNVTDMGSGYRLGYFDEDLQFVQLGYTEEFKVSILKTTNLYVADSKSYTTEQTENGVVGYYHVQLPGMFYDFASAKETADRNGGFVAWIAGAYYVRVGSYVSQEAAMEAATAYEGAVVGETSSYGLSLTITGTTDILFQFDDLGAGTGFGVCPGLDDEIKTQTWCKGYRYFGSFRYQRTNGADITLVNIVDMNDYVNCVISQEMSDSWPLEALKAQAVCARNYYAVTHGKHGAYGFDICASTHCQVYFGASRIGENTTRAAAETTGVYLWYQDQLVEAYYYSSNGGTSECSENVWVSEIPYLRGVVDIYEPLIAEKISNYQWTVTYTGAELQKKLISSGRTNCGLITSLTLTSTEMGNVSSITFHDENGKDWTLFRENCRTVLGMSSMRFGLESGPGTPGETELSGSIYANEREKLELSEGIFILDASGQMVQMTDPVYVLTAGEVAALENAHFENVCGSSKTVAGDTFVFKGSGWGHNVGMSQWGARAMAEQGLDYRAILSFYYTGVMVSESKDITEIANGISNET